MIYYGYHGFRARAVASSDELLVFLGELASAPSEVINPTLRPVNRRPATFSYHEIILVAHSLGAVIARRALLDAHARRPWPEWLRKIRLALFAPAHLGADLAALGPAMLAESFGIAAFIGLNFSVPVWNDLPPESDTIRALVRDTEQALEECMDAGYSTDHLIARAVIFGTLENVVDQGQFCRDVGRRRVPDAGHFGVCKPRTPGRLEPVDILLDALK